MIYVKYIRKANLNKDAFLSVVKRYLRTNLEHDLLITFENSSKDYGSYIFDEKRSRHRIKINVSMCRQRYSCHKDSRDIVQKYNVFATLLHELRHLQQYLEAEELFCTKSYHLNQEIKDRHFSYEFSEAEQDANRYSHQYTLKAVKYYDQLTHKGEKSEDKG